MKLVVQKNAFGCAIACISSIAEIKYKEVLDLFENGKEKAVKKGFNCREIVKAMEKLGFSYKFKYIKNKVKIKIYKPNSIVYLKKSKKYPFGHYLSRIDGKWMDCWINIPNKNRKAGFRKRLPGKPIYVMFEE